MNGSTLNMVEKGSKSKIKLGMRIRWINNWNLISIKIDYSNF